MKISQAFDAQQSEGWFEQRLGRVTASRVADVMAKGRGGAPSATRKNYMMQLLCERLSGEREDFFQTAAMRRGNELEPEARFAYEMQSAELVTEAPFILHPTIKGFGASPDGLVGDAGLLEIKCPNTAQHVAVIQSGKHDPQYEWQMLAQMACTGREWVDFISYDDRMPSPLDYACHRFERDSKRIIEMEKAIVEFLQELDALEKEMRERMETVIKNSRG